MKPTTGDGFSAAAYPTPPTVSQPAAPTIPQRIMFNRSYLASLTGVMRIALIVSVSFILFTNKRKFYNNEVRFSIGRIFVF